MPPSTKTIRLDDLVKGCASFWGNESRDAMYRVAGKLVQDNWGNSAEVADGLGVVLLTWNQAAYRYGSFEFDKLEQFLQENAVLLQGFRSRDIKTYDPSIDAATVKTLFESALDALAYTKEKKRTPVGAAKALHLLAPRFFPLWDQEIAKGCGYNWYRADASADKYVAFIAYAKTAIASLESQFSNGEMPAELQAAPSLAESLSKIAGRNKTMLKFLDEYLYARYTKGWVPA